MKRIVFVLLLTGCAANPPIAPAGGDAFLISRQAATGFSGLGDMPAEALREAGSYCAARGKSLVVIDRRETQPPYVMGNYPRVEVQFRCS